MVALGVPETRQVREGKGKERKGYMHKTERFEMLTIRHHKSWEHETQNTMRRGERGQAYKPRIALSSPVSLHVAGSRRRPNINVAFLGRALRADHSLYRHNLPSQHQLKRTTVFLQAYFRKCRSVLEAGKNANSTRAQQSMSTTREGRFRNNIQYD